MDVAVNARFLLPDRQLEGIGRYTLAVAEAMADERPGATLHLLFDRPFDDRYLTRPNFKPHVITPPARHPVLFLAWFEVGVARWLRVNRPEVFFSPDGFTTLRTRVPRVTTLHDLAFVRYPQDNPIAAREYYNRMTPRFVAASARVLTVSEASRREIIECYGPPPEKVVVAYPGIDEGLWRPADERSVDQLRRRYAAGEEFFLYVGAIHPRKNLPTLLRAFDRYKALSGAGTKLLLVGRQAWKTQATQQALAAMQHRSSVVLTGPVSDDDLRSLYSGALATVFISRYEGFGLPIVEAMACGGTVIASNRSSMPEAAGGAALLVDPLDEGAVAEAMQTLAKDQSMRLRLSGLGLTRASELRWKRTAQVAWRQLDAAAAG